MPVTPLSADRLPFLWGAQYYRAPTPGPECWERDLARMRGLGLTDIKLWMQWRWSHRAPDRFVFDDLLRLMDLAQANALRVTINTIFDVAPVWLYRDFPEAKMVRADGQVLEPIAVAWRQIGGAPGPCLRHPGALAARERCLEAAVRALAPHPALAMWDAWNEPEQAFPSRTPAPGNYVCYCATCLAAFPRWLERRHGSLDALNARWGRCYESFAEAEAPRVPDCIGDWVDWREFQLDGMRAEAQWRLATVARLDPQRVRYLHVVPNTMDCFSSVSGIDDFAVAPECQVFAATMSGSPMFTLQTVSAGHGRVCYDVESHLNFGGTGMHQRVLGLDHVRRELLPQFGLGVKGILFWQYRAETLGTESPAWGLVRPDGSDRPVTAAVQAFGERILPLRDHLMRWRCAPATVGIWKSVRNELAHHAIHGGFWPLQQAISGWTDALYWRGVPLRFVDGGMLARGELDGLRLLVLPSPYFLDPAEAEAIDAFARAGGTVVSEAHLGGYDGGTLRHSGQLPGLGLAARWGLRERESTSSHHLDLGRIEAATGELSPDVRKALAAAGTTGGREFTIALDDGATTRGCERFAWIEGGESVGAIAGMTCIARAAVGAGRVWYLGTRWGQALHDHPDVAEPLLGRILRDAGVASAPDAQARVDVLSDDGRPAAIIVLNRDRSARTVAAAAEGRWRGLFDGVSGPASALPIAGDAAELFLPE